MDVLLAKQEISKSLNRKSTLSRFDICFICAELLNLTHHTKHIFYRPDCHFQIFLVLKINFPNYHCIVMCEFQTRNRLHHSIEYVCDAVTKHSNDKDCFSVIQ